MLDDEPARLAEVPAAGTGSESPRLAQARSHAQHRLRRQRGTLRPLGRAVIVIVAAETIDGSPPPGLHGTAIAVAVALCLFAIALALAINDRFTELGLAAQATVISVVGAASVALAALQPRSASEIAGGAAVWMALARLPLAGSDLSEPACWRPVGHELRGADAPRRPGSSRHGRQPTLRA